MIMLFYKKRTFFLRVKELSQPVARRQLGDWAAGVEAGKRQ
jgi:hypothetical protein